MNDHKHFSFREQLLSQDSDDMSRQEAFRRELQLMYTETLQRSQRLAFVLSGVFIAFFMLAFWALSKIFEGWQVEFGLNFLEPMRLISVWAMLISAVLVGLFLWPAIRGKVGLRFYPKVVRFIFWGLIVAVVTLIFAAFNLLEKQTGRDLSTDIAWIFTLIVLVIVMGVFLLLSDRIDRGDLQSKKKILELEYRLAEMEEKLKKEDGA